MSYAHHTRETLKAALEALAAGGGVREVSRNLGLPLATVSYWKNNHLTDFKAGALCLESEAPADAAEEGAAADAEFCEADCDPALISDDFGSACQWEIDAMRCAAGVGCGAKHWEKFGFTHCVSPYIGPEQSARVFGSVARGVPVRVALAVLPYSAEEIQRCNDFKSWRKALRVCLQWIIEQLTAKVVTGLAGWKAAASRLALLDPANFSETEEARAVARRNSPHHCAL